MRLTLCLLSLIFSTASFSHAEEARLLRFPAIHGDQVVFTYAGDLYTVNSKGGVARRLTSHSGFEMFPKFSPDGKRLYTAGFEGIIRVFDPASGSLQAIFYPVPVTPVRQTAQN